VLSGRGLCDELTTRPEKSYRLCCVVVCDLEKNLKNDEAMTRVGLQRPKKICSHGMTVVAVIVRILIFIYLGRRRENQRSD